MLVFRFLSLAFSEGKRKTARARGGGGGGSKKGAKGWHPNGVTRITEFELSG